jgi:hypothetical protein
MKHVARRRQNAITRARRSARRGFFALQIASSGPQDFFAHLA